MNPTQKTTLNLAQNIIEETDSRRVKDGKACFHGFDVSEEKLPTCKLYNFGDSLYSSSKVVRKAKCISERACDLVIKKYNLSKNHIQPMFNRESYAVKLLMEHRHENIIDYYGMFFEETSAYIVMECGDCDFDVFYEQNKINLSIENINEFSVQLFGVSNFMFNLPLVQTDYGTRNMVFFNKSGLIKIIDMDIAFTKITGSYEVHANSMFSETAKILFKMQLSLKLNGEENSSEKLKGITDKLLNKKCDGTLSLADVTHMIKDNTLWHESLPHTIRDLIGYHFLSIQDGMALRINALKTLQSVSPRRRFTVSST